MAKTEIEDLLPLTPATFHILLSLLTRPMHGYGMKRAVEERTHGRIRLGAGTLYAGLQRMERDGLIHETAPPDETDPERSSRWRFYGVTTLGRQALEAELRRLEADVEAGRTLVPRPGRA